MLTPTKTAFASYPHDPHMAYFGRCVQLSRLAITRCHDLTNAALQRVPLDCRHIHRVSSSDSTTLHNQCTPWSPGGFNEKDIAVKKTATRTYATTKGKKKTAGDGTATARRIIPSWAPVGYCVALALSTGMETNQSHEAMNYLLSHLPAALRAPTPAWV